LPDAAAGREREGQVDLPGGRETILLAEDDEALRILLKDILESYGYAVIQAENGDDVLEKFMLHKAAIDLLLLDMVMPKKNGDEVSAVIRETCPGTRVVLMSGYPPELVSRRDMLQEEAQFIQKPVSPRMLLRKVREVLDVTQPAAARDV
jgi:DNA-binding response OmpR family regulator